MGLIKKIWSILISMQLMVVLVAIFAVASGVATFIENDHGVNTSWALVYSATWFEVVQVLLGISIIGNILKYKTYRVKKLPSFIFHFGFLVILIGSGITRYYGYEGVMHIREHTTEHRMLSSDAYIQVTAKKGNEEHYTEDIVYVSELGGKKFDMTMDIDGKPLRVKYKDFIGKAVKTAVEDPSGVPIIAFVVTTPQGPEKHFVKSGESLDLGPLEVFFDKNPTHNSKPIILINSDGGKFSFISNVPIKWLKMADQSKGEYEATKRYPFEARELYNINGVQLVTKALLPKGKVEVIDENDYKSAMKMNMKFQSLSALVVDVEYDGVTKEVALLGKGKRFKGYEEEFRIGDTDIKLEWGAKIIELPFSLKLRDFILVKYPGSMSPSSYESHVTLIDKANNIDEDHRIYMNHILDYGGYLFFQSSYDQDEKGTILSVNHDPGKWPTYLGYILLGIGLFLNLLNPHSRFGQLARKKYEYKASVMFAVVFIAAMFSSQPLMASSVIDQAKKIDIDHANNFGSILLQGHDGRIKPLDTYNIDLVHKVSGKSELYGLNHNQIILAMASNPEAWKSLKMLKVSHPEVKKLLGIAESEKLFAYEDAFDEYGRYKLADVAEETLRKRPAERGTFDKELIKVDERVNVAYMIYSGRFMKVFPLKDDINHKWFFPEEALQNFPPEQAKEVRELLRDNAIGLQKGLTSGNWSDANKAIDRIKEFQIKYGSAVIPDESIIKAEILYNNLNMFDRLYPVYLIAGFILLILIFVRLIKPNLNIKTIMRLILAVLVVSFIAHTISLGLRWYIAGHAPWSNGYEAMLYISWTIVLAGILFARSSELAMATTAIFAGVTLFVAHLSWLDPQITSMVPVLKSYWLTIHVSIITASYGFLGLSTLLGFVSLIFYMMLGNEQRRERISINILESTRISEMAMIVGLSLLTIGNFLGGVWANESWGRYWGWDPKETWALVSILVYVFVTHMRFVPGMKSNFLFNASSVVAYSSIIMTYFGVNYYLSGLHSYAAGDPVPVPVWVYYAVAVVALSIAVASRNKDKLIKVKPKVIKK